MKKPIKPELSQKTLFKKAARDLGADESEARFDEALKTVAKHKPVDDPKGDPKA